MNEREKLIELLKEADKRWFYFEDKADYLLANGVIVPPVKVGDTVYVRAITSFDSIKPKYKIVKARVTKFIFDEFVCSFWVNTLDGIYRYKIDVNDIGKTVFLTREDAEKALDEITKGTAQNGLAYATPDKTENFELAMG